MTTRKLTAFLADDDLAGYSLPMEIACSLATDEIGTPLNSLSEDFGIGHRKIREAIESVNIHVEHGNAPDKSGRTLIVRRSDRPVLAAICQTYWDRVHPAPAEEAAACALGLAGICTDRKRPYGPISTVPTAQKTRQDRVGRTQTVRTGNRTGQTQPITTAGILLPSVLRGGSPDREARRANGHRWEHGVHCNVVIGDKCPGCVMRSLSAVGVDSRCR